MIHGLSRGQEGQGGRPTSACWALSKPLPGLLSQRPTPARFNPGHRRTHRCRHQVATGREWPSSRPPRRVAARPSWPSCWPQVSVPRVLCAYMSWVRRLQATRSLSVRRTSRCRAVKAGAARPAASGSPAPAASASAVTCPSWLRAGCSCCSTCCGRSAADDGPAEVGAGGRGDGEGPPLSPSALPPRLHGFCTSMAPAGPVLKLAGAGVSSVAAHLQVAAQAWVHAALRCWARCEPGTGVRQAEGARTAAPRVPFPGRSTSLGGVGVQPLLSNSSSQQRHTAPAAEAVASWIQSVMHRGRPRRTPPVLDGGALRLKLRVPTPPDTIPCTSRAFLPALPHPANTSQELCMPPFHQLHISHPRHRLLPTFR